MDLDMSIAALSVDMTQAQTQQALGISVFTEAIHVSDEAMTELLDSIPANLDPNLGTSIDVMA